MNVYDSLNNLCTSLKNSDEFLRYKKAAEKVAANESHSKMLKDFISVQVQLTSMQMFGAQPDAEAIEHFNTLYSTISAVADINEFLQAQSYFSRIMEDVNKAISTSIAVDADFLKVLPGMGSNEEAGE